VSTPTTQTRTPTPQQAATSLFNDVKGTADAIDKGDWLSAGMGVTKVAMDVIGLGGDPLGAISSAGFGWLIGHIKFLREPFDILLGDPKSITGTSSGWGQSAVQLSNSANQYRDATARETANWNGAAADAYRAASATQSANLDSLAQVSKGVSAALAGAGQALAEVRKAVIDMINQACNKIVMIIIEALAEAWGSFGASIAKGIAQSVTTAVQAAQKMLTKIQKLVQTLQKIIQLVQKIMQLVQAVKQLMQSVGGQASGNSGANPVRPTGSSVNYAGNISAGTGPQGGATQVVFHQQDPGPGYHYDGFTPGQVDPVRFHQQDPGPGYHYDGFTPGQVDPVRFHHQDPGPGYHYDGFNPDDDTRLA
jgi:uncharacterized protein YukE